MPDDEDDQWSTVGNDDLEDVSAAEGGSEPSGFDHTDSSDSTDSRADVDSGDDFDSDDDANSSENADVGWPPQSDENDRDESEPAGTDSARGVESEPRANAAVGADDESRPRPDEQYCPSCGEIIKKEARICPHCGVDHGGSASSQEKDPTIAALLSGIGLIFPIAAGAGQMYNGQMGKGIAFCLVQFFNAMLIILLIGLITFPLVGIYTIYDAHQTAKKVNQGEITV
ncbi:zinc ribbon domain-containing protein [Natrialba swarupiae]|uniref:Zinc ribbon domain-containing protein n=1 Tax=Natrialba swarupiae TaxID=2448032 RepID=A0A5D5AJN9_9EURY|nr:zinc ribbon domain-containing protein [Natrialba swarupiae]TYT62108.1 zinc ribbon domain-containing protein [Natrialba swarupiae]